MLSQRASAARAAPRAGGRSAARRLLRRHYHKVRRLAIRATSSTLRILPLPSTLIGPPRRTVSALEEWSRARQDAEYVLLASASRLPLVEPVTLEETPFYEAYCAGTLQRSLHRAPDGSLFCERPARFVARLSGGRVIGCDGAVISASDELITELSPEFESERYVPGRHPVMSTVRLPPVEHVRGTVAVLASLGQAYYAHWMMDLLPRVALLRAAGVDLEDVDAFYVMAPDLPYQAASLAAAGVPIDRVVDCRAHPHVRADQLVVPSPLSEVFQASELSCDFLNELFTPGDLAAVAPIRLFVSRRSTGHRRLVNEDELLAALAPLGFSSLEPQMLSLEDQARAFAAAEVVVGPLGSALANYVYCRPGATIVEIQNARAVQTCSLAVASARRLRYAYMLGEGVDAGAAPLAEDMRVDTGRLLKLLRLLDVA